MGAWGQLPKGLAKGIPKPFVTFFCRSPNNSSGPSANACKAPCLFALALALALSSHRGLKAGFQGGVRAWGQLPKRLAKGIPKPLVAFFCRSPNNSSGPSANACKAPCLFALALALALSSHRGLKAGFQGGVRAWGQLPKRLAKGIPKPLVAFFCRSPNNSSGPSANACKAPCLFALALALALSSHRGFENSAPKIPTGTLVIPYSFSTRGLAKGQIPLQGTYLPFTSFLQWPWHCLP